MKPHLWLIQFIGLIVPRRLRADWRQEWEAELRHRETLLAEWDKLNWRNKLDLLRRSLGAFWDALLLQPQRMEDEMFQDLRYGAECQADPVDGLWHWLASKNVDCSRAGSAERRLKEAGIAFPKTRLKIPGDLTR